MSTLSKKTLIIHKGEVVAIIDHRTTAIETIQLSKEAYAINEFEYMERQKIDPVFPYRLRTRGEFERDIKQLYKRHVKFGQTFDFPSTETSRTDDKPPGR